MSAPRSPAARCAALLLAAAGLAATGAASAEAPDVTRFVQLASPDEAVFAAAAQELAPVWRDGYAALVLDMVRLMPGPRVHARGGEFDPEGFDSEGAGFSGEETEQLNPEGTPARYDPGSPVRRRLIAFLEERTGQHFGDDLDAWRRWLWSLDYDPHPDYAWFKGGVYGNVDPRMRDFFPRAVASEVRLDEVDWGGVKVDGIPALDHPATVPASEAGWLKDKHVVFGLVAGGVARAYPKRIVGWHELVRDTLGGVDVTLVYCTLCGTAVPYDSHAAGRTFVLGTSGFLYRSNKLMYDTETGSLWSTVYGRPVVGPLVGQGIRLRSLPLVTTTWGEWKALHPDTTVVSLNTGYERDYDEGAAYREYFADDALMFAVPATDDRLPNKAEVLVLPFTADLPPGVEGRPLAIATSFLDRQRVFHLERAGRSVVVLTSRRGANRVYLVGDVRMSRWLDDARVEDSAGGVWRVTEEALVPEQEGRDPARRLAAHRAFWFGWYAQHPDTELIR